MISENKKCPCCKSCNDCPGFHKIANLKNIGLLIYQYSVHNKDVKNKQECLQKPLDIKSDVLIVHNKTNVDISADKYLLELDKYTSCPRCKYKFEHAKKLLATIPRIEKLDTVTICNHCRAKVKKPCQECSEIVNTFIASKIQKKKLLKEVLLWLSNVENILEKNEKLSHLQRRTGSQLHVDSLRHISASSKTRHQPQIGQLLEFESSTQSTVHPTKIQFSKKTEIIKDPLVTKSESALLYVHDEKIEYNNKTTPLAFYHSYEHLGQPETIPKPVQQAIELEEDTYASKNLKLQDSLKKGARRDPFEISEHTYDDRNSINKIYKDERPGILLQQTELKSILSKTSLKKGTIHMPLSAQHSEESLQKDFSYFFIEETSKDMRPITKHKSSAELIRDIQDKFEIKLELEKKEKEEKRLKKIKEDEKRRLLKAELERKKLQQLESEKNKKDEKRSSDEELKDGKRIKKKIEAVPLIPKPSVKDINDKNKKKLTDIPKIKESLRVQQERTEKEDTMQADKDRKLKEKQEKEDKMQAEKERKLKEKEEKMQAEKERKLREKQEKEEKMQAEKERKLKEKEEREKLKKEKEESLRKEKEEKRKYEEELRKKKDEEKIDKHQTDLNDTYARELKRMLAEQAKQKEKESKIKSPQEETKKEITVQNKPNEDNHDAEIESKTKKEPPPGKQESKSQKGVTEPKSKGINMNQIKVRTPSPDDLILQLVKLKQSDPDREKKPRPKRLSQLNIPSVTITAHKSHKNKKEPECIICNDSELELDIENIVLNNTKSEKINDIIIGENILKCKPHIEKEVEEIGIAPLFFKSTFKDDGIVNVPKQEIPEYVTETKESKPSPFLPSKYPEQEVPKGVIRYALSDRSFIEKGWTMLPTEKVVRKMNVYRMRPAHPEFDWFEHNKNKKLMLYDTGEKLAEFDENGRGRWFYRNGRLALDYYDTEEINAQQRFVIYSSGEPDERGRSRPLAILATFDYLGNGIVFDHAGKIRLKYNQTEGIILDRSIGPVSHWKWHTLNDPPVLQQVMIDTQMAHKDPEILKLGGPADDKPRPDNEEMLAIEFDNFIKEKSKKLSQKFKPFQIKMKALKINEHFSLKVLDQATVYLIFRDGTTNLKINIGMVLDHQEIVDTDIADVGEVSNSLERFPARTDSLAGLQRSVAYAQRVERARVERDRRLRPTELRSSADRLTAATSRPLRPPLRVYDTSSTVISASRCRKPATCNLYYDTRLS